MSQLIADMLPIVIFMVDLGIRKSRCFPYRESDVSLIGSHDVSFIGSHDVSLIGSHDVSLIGSHDVSFIEMDSWMVMVFYFQQYFSHIVAISFIGGGNRSTQRKPPTCRKSLTNLIK
jgi:hypothetical protein